MKTGLLGLAILLSLAALVHAGPPPPNPPIANERAAQAPVPERTAHVGEAVGPFNHAHYPVRVRSLDSVAWTFAGGRNVGMATPMPDGSVVVLAGGGGLHGLDAKTGKSIRHDAGHPHWWNYSSSVLGPDGVSYAGNYGFVRAVDADGKRLWHTELQCQWIHRPPAVSPDGKTVYVGGDRLGVAALDAKTGRVNWLRRDFRSPWSQYVFNASGQLVVSTSHRVRCFATDGRELWSHDKPFAHMIYADNAYLGVRDGLIQSLDARKPNTNWTFDPGAGVAGMALTDTGYLVAALDNGSLLALDHAGRLQWRTQVSDVALHLPVTTQGGETLVADRSRVLYLLDGSGRTVSRIATGGAPYRWRPSVGRDGSVYLNHANKLICVTGAQRPLVLGHPGGK